MIVTVGCVFQAAADGHIALMYVGRLIAGFGVGKASMVTPLYISENAPRAIRGGLTGIYQLFIATGTMLAFWVRLFPPTPFLEILIAIVDQLWRKQALDRINNLHCTPDHASSSGYLALRLDVLLQGVAQMASTQGSLGRSLGSLVKHQSTSLLPSIRANGAPRDAGAARPRKSLDRRCFLHGLDERDVDHSWKQKESHHYHLAHDHTADDRY